LADMARVAAPGLRKIFSYCKDSTADADLLAWMKEHSQTSAANYVNWIGRTVRQIREEARLRDELIQCVRNRQQELVYDRPPDVRAKLIAHCQPLLTDGTLSLTRPQRTPLGWSLRNFLHYATIPGALLLPWLLAIPSLIPLPPV